MMIVSSRRAEGYLDSLIINPATLNQLLSITTIIASGSASTMTSLVVIPAITAETPWNLLILTAKEWRNHNFWVKMLLLFNTIELTDLRIDTEGTAASTQKFYITLYSKKMLVDHLNAEMKLRNIFLVTNGDFPAYISFLKKKLSYARAIGANILNANFATIVLNSLPPIWNSIVVTVFENDSSGDIISKLHAWQLRVYQNCNQNTLKSIIALYTFNPQYQNQCHNMAKQLSHYLYFFSFLFI